MPIVMCRVCGKPLRYEAISDGGHHPAQMEAVPCPYGSHSAAERLSSSWWQSFMLSAEERQIWRAANPDTSRQSGLSLLTLVSGILRKTGLFNNEQAR